MAAGSLLFAGTSLAQPAEPLATLAVTLPRVKQADVSVMTYNVKGLPWPIAHGRPAALEQIGERLAEMRRARAQPSVVVLQEAFTSKAKKIGDLGGYRYQAGGAGVKRSAHAHGPKRVLYRRESKGPQIDSGLMILSDFPIEDVSRAAFPQDACAGFDCLAAKGIVLVTVRIPGKGPVAIATTHLNSRGASKAPITATTRAYRDQVDFLVQFLRDNRDEGTPLVLAGDFNLGDRPERLAILPPALTALNGDDSPTEALSQLAGSRLSALNLSSDAQWIVERARDMQFVFPGHSAALVPTGGNIPFGTEPEGESLSDHFGYTIEYRLDDRASLDTRLAAIDDQE